MIAAGIQMKDVPPIGSSDNMAATTPNTTGDGRPMMAKPIPMRTPCNSAVMVVP